MKYVITLVHGTHAKNAPWTWPDSKLSGALSDGLEEAYIEAVTWSGGNSVKARADAQSELRATIEAKQLRHPSAAHFVIAHSHGGNVALYAQEQLARPLDGTVCLSTPFLVARRRALGGFDVNHISLGCLAVTAIFAYVLRPGLYPQVPSLWVAVGVSLITMLATLLRLTPAWPTEYKRAYQVAYWIYK